MAWFSWTGHRVRRGGPGGAARDIDLGGLSWNRLSSCQSPQVECMPPINCPSRFFFFFLSVSKNQ